MCQTGLIGVPFPIEVVEPGRSARSWRTVGRTGRPPGRGPGHPHHRHGRKGGPGGRRRLLRRGPWPRGRPCWPPTWPRCWRWSRPTPGSTPEKLAAGRSPKRWGPPSTPSAVDGCTSTNDTVLVLASGLAGPPPPGALEAALGEACASLAGQMAADAEGATKLVRIRVTGAASDGEAHRAARKVAESSAGQVFVQRRGPLLGPGGERAGHRRGGLRPRPSRRSPTAGVTVCAGGVGAAHDTAAVALPHGRPGPRGPLRARTRGGVRGRADAPTSATGTSTRTGPRRERLAADRPGHRRLAARRGAAVHPRGSRATWS